MVDGQLQGRARAHRQGAGSPALPDDSRDRFCRRGRKLGEPRMETGRPRHPQRLGRGMTGREAMATGPAGYTAMLAVLALERHAITPARGPVVVTGAAGGVGSVAIAVLGKLGYHVIASTGRAQETAYLQGLGAA